MNQTEILGASDIARAAALLRAGELVAIPTETVYGLGANALDAHAVKKIFEVKGRPADNPLIIHVLGPADLDRWCQEIPASARLLAARFWPGPVTMILKKSPAIPAQTSAGLDTIAVRCPQTPLTRMLLAAVDFPIAAPSANLSGRPSTTTLRHVLDDLSGKIPAVLDGGDCSVGLESTIIDLTVQPPMLLRPGGITLEQLRSVLCAVTVDPTVLHPPTSSQAPKAPGMKYRHYAPHAPLTLVKGAPSASAAYISAHCRPDCGVLCFEEYLSCFPSAQTICMGSMQDETAQAHLLFDALRQFDETDVQQIFAQCPAEQGLGLALVNRLNKAAGFHIVNLEVKP